MEHRLKSAFRICATAPNQMLQESTFFGQNFRSLLRFVQESTPLSMRVVPLSASEFAEDIVTKLRSDFVTKLEGFSCV